MIRKLLATAALTAMMAASAFAADDKPAIVFDIGGKFDKSFNESMYNGSEKFKAELSKEVSQEQPTHTHLTNDKPLTPIKDEDIW